MAKEQIIRLRVSVAEKQRIKEYADTSGMGMSDYLRRVALKGTVFRTIEESEGVHLRGEFEGGSVRRPQDAAPPPKPSRHK